MASETSTKSTERKQPRQKAWYPKVRTGCLTCKRRKVKCDETKPCCIRCIKAQVTCEGYVDPPRAWLFEPRRVGSSPEPTSPVPAGTQTNVPLPTSSTGDCLVGISQSPSKCDLCHIMNADGVCHLCLNRARGLTANDDALAVLIRPRGAYETTAEQFYFKYFVEVVATALSRSNISSSFWLSSFPQAAWFDSTVRNALISNAIGFRHVHHMYQVNKVLTLPMSTQAAAGYENRAIHSLLADRPPIEAILTSSVAFWLNAMMFGDWKNGLRHSYHALKLCVSVTDRSKHDLNVLKYAEGLARCNLMFFRITRGPCYRHTKPNEYNGPDLLACDVSCYTPEERPLEERLIDALHHLEPVPAALIDLRHALTSRRVRHSEHERTNALITRAVNEVSKLKFRWNDFATVGLDPDKIRRAQVKAPYTHSPFVALLGELSEYIEKDHESRFTFAKLEIRMRAVMPILAVSTGGENASIGLGSLIIAGIERGDVSASAVKIGSRVTRQERF